MMSRHTITVGHLCDLNIQVNLFLFDSFFTELSNTGLNKETVSMGKTQLNQEKIEKVEGEIYMYSKQC